MKRLFSFQLCLLALAFHSSGQTNTGPGDHNTGVTDSDKLIGAWRIIEYSDFDSTIGKWTDRYGKHPRGYFIYTRGGIVSINISTGNPMKISEDSAKNLRVNYYQNINSNAFAYFGTYTVDWRKSVVTHYVKGGSLLWYIDTDQPRQFMLRGDTLTIGDNKRTRRVLVRAD